MTIQNLECENILVFDYLSALSRYIQLAFDFASTFVRNFSTLLNRPIIQAEWLFWLHRAL